MMVTVLGSQLSVHFPPSFHTQRLYLPLSKKVEFHEPPFKRLLGAALHQAETQMQLFLGAGRFFFCSTNTAEHRGIASEFVPSSDRAQIKIKSTTEGSQFMRPDYF